MLNEDEINALADIFQDRFDKANRKILEYIGSRLKEIGELTPSQARKIQQMYKYGEDLDTITQYLAEASGQSIDDIEALYEKVAEEGYDWSKPFYEAKGIKQIPFKENKDVQRIIKAMCAVTGKSLKNISRTTAIGVNTAGGFKPVGSFYKETIDSAITAVITGTDDYNSTIRRAVKELGSGGLKIQYESGYRRRLDSAVRQNVLDGVRYVTHEIAVKNGEEFGADGYEISAHSACAPDHLPYQGRQYSKKEYEAIQESLARPIGQWNCGHTAFPIVLGVSHRAYTDKELKAFEQNSNEKITIEGREYTRYECTQLQRKLETKLRYAREEKALYKAVGDKELVNGATAKIQILKNKYAEVSEKADLPMRKERTRGVTEELKNKVTNSQRSVIINSKLSDKFEVIAPMDKKRYYRMKKGLEKQGYSVVAAVEGSDDAAFLKSFGAEAISDRYGIIHLGEFPSASAFFEEVIHLAQIQKYGDIPDSDFIERTAREVAANKKLLKNAKVYGFTTEDIQDISENLKKWELDFEKKVGVPYEKSGYNRGI